MKPTSIDAFHEARDSADRAICDALRSTIDACLADAESKIWHGHPPNSGDNLKAPHRQNTVWGF